MNINHLASETVQDILLYLPIDPHLQSVGLASSRVASILFHSLSFARRHFKQEASDGVVLQRMLCERNRSPLALLPINYQTWIYLELTNQADKPVNLYPWLGTESRHRKVLFLALANCITFSPSFIVWPCNLNQPRIVQQLLSEKRVDTSAHSCLLFRLAVKFGYTALVKDLLNQPKADPNICHQSTRQTAWDLAIEFNRIDIIKLFLADTKIQFSSGLISEASPRVIKLFLEDGRASLGVCLNQYFLNTITNGSADLLALFLADPRITLTETVHLKFLELCGKRCQLDLLKKIELLLKDGRLDPSFCNNSALQKACCQDANLELVHLLLADSRTWPSDDLFCKSIKSGNFELVKLLSSHPRVVLSVSANLSLGTTSNVEVARFLLFHPRINLDMSLQDACFKGHLHIVRLLLSDSRINASANINSALVKACEGGDFEVVDVLMSLPQVDTFVQEMAPFRLACKFGHVEIVRRLLEVEGMDPSTHENYGIYIASKYNHVDVARLLLQQQAVDPSDAGNRALVAAVRYGNVNVVQLLLSDPRVDPAAEKVDKLRAWRIANEIGWDCSGLVNEGFNEDSDIESVVSDFSVDE
ncbi:UNVERIFIED_CONTAM: hypothetical protein HDU68_012360 [Siphonaria sp. JEL0065]|nr:hypothetical protein HDU68_012360 [Siphonaria sp. JEL0065]